MSSLDALSKYYGSGSYKNDLYNLIAYEENDKLYINGEPLIPTWDGQHSISIGYGIDLLKNSQKTLNDWFLGTGLSISDDDEKLINKARQNTSEANLREIASELSQKLAFKSADDAMTVLRRVVDKKDSELTDFLKNYNISIDDSRERIALVSLYFNTPALIGHGLRSALKSGNRAEAWWEIRYNSNGDHKHAMRRYAESAMFGMYATDSTGNVVVSKKDALNVYRMYTSHAVDMINYDEEYASSLSLAEGYFQDSNHLADISNAQDLTNSLAPAANVLIAEYAPGESFDPLHVYVADGDSPDAVNANLLQSKSANWASPVLLIGGGKSNILMGLSGDDYLVAGDGSDTLKGSFGDDAYQLGKLTDEHDTTETIKDADGNGSILIGALQLTGSANADLSDDGGVYTWTGDNGEKYTFAPRVLSSSQNIGTLTITGDVLGAGANNKVVINDFDLSKAQSNPNGYLGIHLKSALKLQVGTEQLTLPKIIENAVSPEGVKPGAVTLTAYVSTVSDKPQTLMLNMSQGDAAGFDVITSTGQLHSLGGGVELTVPPGANSVSFSLLNTSELTSPEAIKLALSSANVSSSNVTPYTLEVDYAASLGASTNNNKGTSTSTPDQVILGADVADRIRGTSGNDLIKSGEGNDSIRANQGGNDTIISGNGADTISASNGNNQITVGDGQDIITAGNGNNQINVGKGNVRINVLDGNNTVTFKKGGHGGVGTGNGDNVIIMNDGQEAAILGDGNNQVYGIKKEDIATAIEDKLNETPSGKQGIFFAVGGGYNTLVGGTGNDLFALGGGNDLVICGPGNDTIEGGEKVTTVWPDWHTTNTVVQNGSSKSYVVDIEGADPVSSGGYSGSLSGDQIRYDADGNAAGVGSETIIGGSGNDYIAGSNGPGNYIYVGNGNSTVFGGAGDDTIYAGSGNDIISGMGGNDYIQAGSGDQKIFGGEGNNTIYGGDGDDTILAGYANYGWDTINGGNNYVIGGSGKSVIYGSGGNDTLISGSGDTTIVGGSGNEFIQGGSGKDELWSQSTSTQGSTTIVAGGGDNTLHGGNGRDYLYGGDGTDIIYGGNGTDVIYTGDGGTSLDPTKVYVGAGTTTVYGGDGVDQILGGSRQDTLIAGDGTATLKGGSGDEILKGGAGDDVLIAGSGYDTLYGGSGNSTMQGGSGSTLFVSGIGQNSMIGGSGKNTFEINSGFGNVLIQDAKSSDVLKFGLGINLSDLVVTAGLGNTNHPVLKIRVKNEGVISIAGGLSGLLNRFEIDGTEYNARQLSQAAISQSVKVQGVTGDLHFSAEANDQLTGGAGNDTLAAFGENTTLVGGGGDTLFDINDTSEVVSESYTDRNDTIQSSVSYVLPENVNNLTLTGSSNLVGTGNDQEDVLVANNGNDTLIAGSGLATMVGGSGGDTFVVNNVNDVVQAQEIYQGLDANPNIVESSVSYVVPENVQTLILTGTENLVGTGNDQANTILANSGNDTLIAGAGISTLVGGSGDDTFIVNNSSDVVQADSHGANTVETSVSYVMPANVQNLVATGASDVQLTANADSNSTVVANAGNDTLAGGGGNGTLVGGVGTDTYVLGAPGIYSAEKSASSSAIIQLMQGFSFDGDVSAFKSGNDLLLQVGDKSGLKVKDYFASENAWTIEDAQGNIITAETLIKNTEAYSKDKLTWLEHQFETGVKEQYMARLNADGYVYNKDGGYWYRPLALSGGVSATYEKYVNTFQGVSGLTQSGTKFTINSNAYGDDSHVYIEQTTTEASSQTVYASDHTDSWTSSSDWLKVKWGSLGTPHTHEYTQVGQISLPSNAGTSGPEVDPSPAVPIVEHVTVTDYAVQAVPDGSLSQAILSSPSGYTSTGDYPQVVSFTYSHNYETDYVQRINLGAGNHVVHGNEHTLVDAGSGDNYIWDTGFVAAGGGNDTIANAGTVYCEDGNDLIQGASVVYGGSGSDTIYGGSSEELFSPTAGYSLVSKPLATVYGGTGNDLVVGAAEVTAGTGTDTIYGSGPSTININADIGGMDLIGNKANLDTRFLDAYYKSLGISDGAERYQYGGSYLFPLASDGITYVTKQKAESYYPSPEMLQRDVDEGIVRYIEPLPDTAPLIGLRDQDYSLLNNLLNNPPPIPSEDIPPNWEMGFGQVFPSNLYLNSGRTIGQQFSANDFSALTPYFDSGELPSTSVKFGPGIGISNLKFTWSVVESDLGGVTVGDPYYGGQTPVEPYAALNISWGTNEGVKVIIPHEDDPIGSGIQEFAFADGTTLSMADMIALAPPAPTFDPEIFDFKPGMGLQVMPAYAQKVVFGSGIDFSELTLNVDGADLILSADNGADELRIPDGATDSSLMSNLSFSFADGSMLYSSIDAQGDVTLTHYDALGNNVGDTWANADGSHGIDVLNPDGSSFGSSYNVDGSYSTYTNDGKGDVLTSYYDAAGDLTGDSWRKADGSYGADTFNADGSSTGNAHNPDGSYSDYTNDGHGDVTTLKYDSAGSYIGDQWNRADGSYGTDNYNAASGQFTGNYTLENGSTVVVDTTSIGGNAPLISTDPSDTLNGDGSTNTLLGFGSNDTLTAGPGGDLVYGSGDGDFLVGGTGNDTLIGTGNNDTFVINAGDGVDTIIAAGTNDTIVFGAGITPDMITLGLGSLLLRVGPDGQAVHIEGFNPKDALNSGSIQNFQFADGTVLSYDKLLERGFDIYASDGDVSVSGTNLDNRLYGGDGSDTLIGTGANDTLIAGTGIDTIIGGLGNETFVVNNIDDVVVAQAGASSNSVESSVSFEAPDNVENLTLTDSADINGTGNSLDNVITGNDGNNVLDGAGGSDTLIGGVGNDTYVVDNTKDIVIEQQNNGMDTVRASVDYTLTDNVENLVLTGNADISGTGNGLDNVITGNAGNNILDGAGGSDTLIGGAGNDTYVVDNPGDTVVEQADGGIDTVRSSFDYVLPNDIENLTLTGSADISGTGNSLDNELAGNSGNNTLIGAGGNDTFVGGTGDDVLIGGTGNDDYMFNLGDGLDTISDAGGNNVVRFGSGLSSQNVSIRLTTTDGKPYTIYENNNHRVYPDEDSWRDEFGHSKSITLTAHVRVLDANGCEQPDQGMDFNVTVDRRGNIVSPIQDFTFSDGSSNSFDDLLIKTDVIRARWQSSPLMTGRNDDLVYTGPFAGGVWAGSGNDTVYASWMGTKAYGEGGDDILNGWFKKDTLDGGWGVDMVSGGRGDDVLSDPGGNSALFGGRGNDRITTGDGDDFIAGGRGNDVISTGATHNVVAFNGGDGNDTIFASPGAENTLSLGHVRYQDLTFSKDGENLVLHTSRRDSITFKDWYADSDNQDFDTLQVIGAGDWHVRDFGHAALDYEKVSTFDFSKLVAEFDQVRASNPSLKSWHLTDGLGDALTAQVESQPASRGESTVWADMNRYLDDHLRHSDVTALGGSLAYDYAMHGDVGGVNQGIAQATLRDSQYGKSAQSVQLADVNRDKFSVG